MLKLIEVVLTYIAGIINHLGFWGVAAGMLLESACIPLPSELILPIAGFMAAEGRISFLAANISALAGSLAGSIIAYLAGYYGGRPFIIKYGKYFLISEEHFYKAEKFFNRYGKAAVFFGRLLPVIRTFISLPAGITKMKPSRFFTYSLLGVIPWNLLLIFLGYKFRERYDTVIRPIFKQFELVIEIAIVAVIVVLILRVIMKRIKRSSK